MNGSFLGASGRPEQDHEIIAGSETPGPRLVGVILGQELRERNSRVGQTPQPISSSIAGMFEELAVINLTKSVQLTLPTRQTPDDQIATLEASSV